MAAVPMATPFRCGAIVAIRLGRPWRVALRATQGNVTCGSAGVRPMAVVKVSDFVHGLPWEWSPLFL